MLTFKDTPEALLYGRHATDEQLEDLKILRKEAYTKAQFLLQQNRLQEACEVATQAQFYREALEEADEVAGRLYKAY